MTGNSHITFFRIKIMFLIETPLGSVRSTVTDQDYCTKNANLSCQLKRSVQKFCVACLSNIHGSYLLLIL